MGSGSPAEVALFCPGCQLVGTTVKHGLSDMRCAGGLGRRQKRRAAQPNQTHEVRSCLVVDVVDGGGGARAAAGRHLCGHHRHEGRRGDRRSAGR